MDVLLFLAGIFVGYGLALHSWHRMAAILLTTADEEEKREAARDKEKGRKK